MRGISATRNISRSSLIPEEQEPQPFTQYWLSNQSHPGRWSVQVCCCNTTIIVLSLSTLDIELDETSQKWAEENVSRNNLDWHIQIRSAQAQQQILFPLADASLRHALLYTSYAW